MPVGYFEGSQSPSTLGLYRYMPYRGPGHYEMQERLRAGDPPPRCSNEYDGVRVTFTVKGCTAYGVLELHDFESSSRGDPLAISTREHTIEYLRTCGHETFPRDWALGETIAVGQGKFTEGSITGFRHLIYLCPSDGGWTIHDLAILTEPDDNLRFYSLGAAIIAADALMKKKVARSDP